MNDASVALAARVVLAVALAVSGTAKLRSRAAVQRQVALLVNDRMAPLIGRILPAAELAVAVALVVWWGPVPGVVALLLLAAFTVVLVRGAGPPGAVPVLRRLASRRSGRAGLGGSQRRARRARSARDR